VLPLAVVLPSVVRLQTALIALTVVVGVVCLIAMELICRRDRVRRAQLDVFGRAVQGELAESGYRAIIGCPLIFCLVLVLLQREGGGMLPGLIGGGVLGLAVALGVPDRAIAYVRPDFIKKMDPAKRRLHQEFRRRRNPALVVAAVAPLFLAAYILGERLEVGYAHEPEQAAAIGFLLGAVQVAALAWGVQCVQVLHSLRRTAAVEAARIGAPRWRTQAAPRPATGDRYAALRRIARAFKSRTEPSESLRD
jgi:hypothetical protein